MNQIEQVARDHNVTLTYKLHVIDNKTKKEYYIERSMTEPEVVEYISKKAFENCTVLGYPNIRTASGDNIKVFK